MASENLFRRIQSEYLEMPGLRLTAGQAARLWGLSLLATEGVIDALTNVGFLVRTPDATYRRRDDGSVAGGRA